MPIRICSEPRCPNEARYRGRCRAHAASRERATHLNKAFYNSAKWVNTRRRQLFDHPLCECGAVASEVDHVVPIEQGGDRWAFTNLQSMCDVCHGRKTRQEQATQ